MKQTITIKRVNNLEDMKPVDPEQVEAEVFGHLAVHRSIAGDDFTVSHVPTGMAIRRYMSKLEALALVTLLGCLNWDFREPKEANDLEGEVKRAIGELKAHGAFPR